VGLLDVVTRILLIWTRIWLERLDGDGEPSTWDF
jgi:hypothetical protein